MSALFVASSFPQFSPREEAIINDMAINDAKNVWSIRFPDADPSHSPGVLEHKVKSITVGIHVAALTVGRRLQSRRRRKPINAQQRRYAMDAI
jgi:hypothetical protein